MLPNFIIVGAAKAGTTALYWYLAEHPAVFMSPVKETNFFAYGVDEQGRLLYGNPDIHRFPIKSLPEYEKLFDGAGTAKAIGEASPIYLECPQAAGRIRQLIPAARIICSIRHPVDRAYSNYLMYLRRRGREFDPTRELTATADWTRPDTRWMQVSRYAEQLSRYFAVFPRDQLFIILFDDLQRDPLEVTQNTYRFLDVDPGFVPDFSTPHALGGVPASRLVERFLTNDTLGRVARPLVPQRAINWVKRLRTRNMRQAPPLSRELKRELTTHFRDDIRRTSDLIGRSLDHWL